MRHDTLKQAIDFAREMPGVNSIYKIGVQFEVIDASIEVNNRKPLVTVDSGNKNQYIHY